MYNYLQETTLFGEIIRLKKFSFIVIILFSIILSAQRHVLSTKSKKNIILHTNAKTYVSKTTLETLRLFVSTVYTTILNSKNVNDILHSQISFNPRPQTLHKTIGNIPKNSNCGCIDIITKKNLTYLYTDDITTWYRLSLDDAKPNSKKNATLLNKHNKFSFSKPKTEQNAINENAKI